MISDSPIVGDVDGESVVDRNLLLEEENHQNLIYFGENQRENLQLLSDDGGGGEMLDLSSHVYFVNGWTYSASSLSHSLLFLFTLLILGILISIKWMVYDKLVTKSVSEMKKENKEQSDLLDEKLKEISKDDYEKQQDDNFLKLLQEKRSSKH